MDDDRYNQIDEAFDELLEGPSQEDFIGDMCAAAFRAYWRLYLEPPQSLEEANERLAPTYIPSLRRWLEEQFDESDIAEFSLRGRINEDLDEGRFRDLSAATSFEEFVDKELADFSGDDAVDRVVTTVWRRWHPRLTVLSPNLVSSVKDVYQEYMLWLQKHPEALDKIAWEAFERLVAEVFASNGFSVDLTGRVRNRSADLIAVRTDAFGVETKYLVECKRYHRSRRIGLDIVNGVLGAARRASVDHAFLVTSSVFTQEVEKQRQTFTELRLHLRDGHDVREWLRGYTVRPEGGLWLAAGWDETIQQPDRTRLR